MSNYYQQKTVLLTGAAGLIGVNLSLRLLKEGVSRLIAVDNFITSKKRTVETEIELELRKELGDEVAKQMMKAYTFIEADVTQKPTTYLPSEYVTGKKRIDLILHFASPASPPLYQKYPVETYLVNSWGTHLLLDFLKQTNKEGRFLFAGTSEAYGTPLEHPQRETYWGNVNPNGVRACYDEAKRLGETISGVFWRDFEMDTRIVRIFNTYGPWMDLNDGRILPEFIKQYRAGKALQVYGDGLQTRSYCYVTDLVEGIIRLAGGEREKLGGETINLGNPGEYTVLETAKIFNRTVGRDENLIEYQDLPTDDPTRRQPAIEKAEALLDGWQPRINFEEGLRMTLDFFGW